MATASPATSTAPSCAGTTATSSGPAGTSARSRAPECGRGCLDPARIRSRALHPARPRRELRAGGCRRGPTARGARGRERHARVRRSDCPVPPRRPCGRLARAVLRASARALAAGGRGLRRLARRCARTALGAAPAARRRGRLAPGAWCRWWARRLVEADDAEGLGRFVAFRLAGLLRPAPDHLLGVRSELRRVCEERLDLRLDDRADIDGRCGLVERHEEERLRLVRLQVLILPEFGGHLARR